MISVYEFAYWASIFFVVVGAVLGIIGVWVPDFWKNDIAAKLIFTDLILAGSSVAVAIITRWLGSA